MNPTRRLLGSPQSKKVCVIGGGPAGLAALKRLKERGFDHVTCLEKQSKAGGLWNFDVRNGVDTCSFFPNHPRHGSMYHHLFTNGPKECIEYPDYPFEQHFGFELPSFPPRAPVLEYIRGRHAQYIDDVETSSEVVSVLPLASSAKQSDDNATGARYEVTWCKRDGDELSLSMSENTIEENRQGRITGSKTETFDKVVVACGHFSKPFSPPFPGLQDAVNKKRTKVIHVHDFRTPEVEMKGKRVLVVGSSCSAEDMASFCVKYGAISCAIACRAVDCNSLPIMRTMNWPDSVSVHTNLQEVQENRMIFEDGSTIPMVDLVILCTGYRHSFPFLEGDAAASIRLEVEKNSLFLDGLYRGVVLEKDPNIAYLGMMDQWFTLTLFDAQASFIAKAWSHEESQLIPNSRAAREEHSARIKREVHERIKERRDECEFQMRHMAMLYKKAGVWDFDVDKYGAHCVEQFMAWQKHKLSDVLTFRDKQHIGFFTGKRGVDPKWPWLQDGSDVDLAAYKRTYGGSDCVPHHAVLDEKFGKVFH